jgi:catechol 2,3-dioxygenase-like lactoylglutathione lyase family enzyme
VILGVEHFAFNVSNLDDAVHFFRDLLGLETSPIRMIKGQAFDKITNIPDMSARTSRITAPDKTVFTVVEHIWPKGEKIDPNICNVGVPHLAFLVDDIEKTYNEFVAKGLQFISPPVWIKEGPAKGCGVCYLKGPDDFNLELVQPDKGLE